jgi:glutamyl-Q tRNA(Asp) synthetase
MTDLTAPVAPLYRGRFAPSPTGPLHFGSLVAAVASYLQARSNDGEWLVRIEDIDPPRELAGAADDILRALEAHGFEFAPPLYQSSRLEAYDNIIAGLMESGHAYHCSCTRQMLRASARTGSAGIIYPGTCRVGAIASERPAVSVRVLTTEQQLCYEDAMQGTQCCHPESEIGDFLLRRGDGLVAYQLAVVADDQAQGITEIVRGCDLLQSTFMQVWLQQLLDYDKPKYMHVPVAVLADGEKLSKQTGATGLNSTTPVKNIFESLVFLKQNPDAKMRQASVGEIWAWALDNWRPAALAGQQSLPDRSMILQ